MIDIPQGIPSQIIDLAEKNVEQARGAFLGFIGAAQKATDATETLPSSAKDAMTKAMSFAENNVNAAFDLAQKLVRAKDVSEVLALQSEFAKAQMAAMQTQTKELGAVAQDVIASAIRAMTISTARDASSRSPAGDMRGARSSICTKTGRLP